MFENLKWDPYKFSDEASNLLLMSVDDRRDLAVRILESKYRGSEFSAEDVSLDINQDIGHFYTVVASGVNSDGDFHSATVSVGSFHLIPSIKGL